MHIKSTYFMDFRGISPQRAAWSPGINLIVGPNGAGKTNYLEGLSMVCGWGPLEKGSKISSLVTWSAQRASLWAGASGEESVEIFLSIGRRCSIKIDDRSAPASRVRSVVPLISFLSDHILIVKGSSSYRRGLLDRAGSIMLPSYARALSDYRRVLRHKSVLLRKGCDTRAVDRALVPLGDWLWRARAEVASRIAEGMSELSYLLPGRVEVAYSRGGDLSGCGDIADAISKRAPAERASRTALVGPHRDDLIISCDGRPAADHLSRGQCRKTATVMVLSSARAVEDRLSRKPVLVFDEIASELDREGRAQTFDALLSSGCQVFASSTEGDDSEGASVRMMREGRFV